MRDRGVLITQVINSTSDVVLLTGAIYFTGGPYSPLIATYVVVISAVALLSNVGVTWLAGAWQSLRMATQQPVWEPQQGHR